MLYPKRPGSFYHLSEVHDSHNIELATRTWGLAATDLNQGIVHRQETEETRQHPHLTTRFDHDAVFGTVLNCFVVQAACGHPLTVYGTDEQTRGLLDIRDTVDSIRIACEHPAAPGELRVFNQFTEEFSVRGIASMVPAAAGGVSIAMVDKPRVEADEHYCHAIHSRMIGLGPEPHRLSDTLVRSVLVIARRHRHHTDPSLFAPNVRWQATESLVGPRAAVLVT